jgi:hypothetical protein
MPEKNLLQSPNIQELTIKVLHNDFSPEERLGAIATIKSENSNNRKDGQKTDLEKTLPSYMHVSLTRDLNWSNLGNESTEQFIKRSKQDISILKELDLDESVLRQREESLAYLAIRRGSYLLTPEGVNRFISETSQMGISEEAKTKVVAEMLADSVIRPNSLPEHFAAGIEGVTGHGDDKLRAINRLNNIDKLATGLNIQPEALRRSSFELIKNAADTSSEGNKVNEARKDLGLTPTFLDVQVALLNGLDRSVTALSIDQTEANSLIDNVASEMFDQIRFTDWRGGGITKVQENLEMAKKRFNRLNDGVKARLTSGFTEAVKVPEEMIVKEKARVEQIRKEMAARSLETKANYEAQGTRFASLKDVAAVDWLTSDQQETLVDAMTGQYGEDKDNFDKTEIAVLKPTSFEDLRRLLLENSTHDNMDVGGDGYTAVQGDANNGFDLYAIRPDLDKSTFVRISHVGKLSTQDKQVVLASPRYPDIRRAQWKIGDKDGDYWKGNPTFVLVRNPQFPK